MISSNPADLRKIVNEIAKNHGTSEAEKYLNESEREIAFNQYVDAGLKTDQLLQMFPERRQEIMVQRGLIDRDGTPIWPEENTLSREDWQSKEMLNKYKSPETLQETLADTLQPQTKGGKPPIPPSMQGPVTGSYYNMEAPEPNKDWAFVGDRKNFSSSGDWYPKGEKFADYKDKLGISFQDQELIDDSMHNRNLTGHGQYDDDTLNKLLNEKGLSTEGTRQDRIIRGNNFAESGINNLDDEDLTRRIPVTDEQIDQALFNKQWEAGRQMRADQSKEIGGFRSENIPENNPIQMNQQPRYQGSPPVNSWTGDSVPNDNWGQNNIKQMSQRPQNNIKTLANLKGPQGAANMARPLQAGQLGAEAGAAGEMGAAAGGMGAAEGAAMFASRAVPILNLVMLGGMLMKQARSGERQKEAQQKQLMYRS